MRAFVRDLTPGWLRTIEADVAAQTARTKGLKSLALKRGLRPAEPANNCQPPLKLGLLAIGNHCTNAMARPEVRWRCANSTFAHVNLTPGFHLRLVTGQLKLLQNLQRIERLLGQRFLAHLGVIRANPTTEAKLKQMIEIS